MARLISITAYAADSTVYSSASPMLIGADQIIVVQNATLAAKKSVPAASGSINSRVVTNTETNNAGERHVYLVGETQATILTASA